MKINLEFYNDAEKDLFKANYPVEFALFNLSIGDIDVPVEDFKTYFLFRHQFDYNEDTFSKFSDELLLQWPYFDRYFNYDSSSENFHTKRKVQGTTEIPESLGVAGALSIATKVLFNGTQADWRKIPESHYKDLDFSHIASNGSSYIEVEAKGCISDDNTVKNDSIYKHKKSIKDKKDEKISNNRKSSPNDCLFGIITCADDKNTLKAYLVDPPAFRVEMSPQKYRVLARLYYYHDLVHYISSRSYVSIALANRIKILAELPNFESLQQLPLLNSNFDKLKISESFIATRSFVDISNERIIGRCEIKNNSVSNEMIIVYVGVPLNAYELIIEQDYNKLIEYNHNPSTVDARLTCRVRDDGKYKAFFRSIEVSSREGYYSFFADTTLTIASSGLVYGLITPEQVSKISMF